MPDSETKILRDELARTIAELGRKDRTIADKDLTIVGLTEQLAEVTAEKTMLTAENQQLKQHIKYYENPHTPSSQNSIPTRQKKTAAAKASGNVPASAKAKPGRRQGHKGISHKRMPTEFVKHCPKKCDKCGSTNMKKPKRMFSKTVTEIPKRPKPVTTQQHTAYKRECADCGHVCMEDDRDWNVPGTEFGPNITGMITSMHMAPASIQATATMCSEILNMDVSEAGVLQCLRA